MLVLRDGDKIAQVTQFHAPSIAAKCVLRSNDVRQKSSLPASVSTLVFIRARRSPPRGEQVELRITHRVLGDGRLGLGAAGAPFGVDDLDVGAGPAR